MRFFVVLTVCACATRSQPPPECPAPPPPIYSEQCVHRSDVIKVVESMESESERHHARVDELEHVLLSMRQHVADALRLSLANVPNSEAQVSVVGGKVRVRLSDELLFDSGSARISERGRRALAQVAGVLIKTPSRRFEVAGHTDDQPVHREFTDNWQLSAERARQVALFLMDRGIPGRRLFTSGYADTDPVDPRDRARNRRVELYVDPVAGDGAGLTRTSANKQAAPMIAPPTQ